MATIKYMYSKVSGVWAIEMTQEVKETTDNMLLSLHIGDLTYAQVQLLLM